MLLEPLPRRQCGTCIHWGMMRVTSNTGHHYVDGPNALPRNGVIVRTCGQESRTVEVVNGISWARGSDTCSKWER